MTMTHWTFEDIATLTYQALTLAALDDDKYCAHCKVMAIHPDDKYCPRCTNEITEYLAAVYTEQGSMDKGLY